MPASTTTPGFTQEEIRLSTIDQRLRSRYGTPDLGNANDVFGELVFALLSTKSAPSRYQDAFQRLKERFPCWQDLLKVSPNDIATTINACGFQNKKATSLHAIAERVFEEDGMPDLEHLHHLKTADAERYLLSLPGVGIKVAKCVVLYALQRPVLPLDTHNYRVLLRLGFIDPKTPLESAAHCIEQRIPQTIRYTMHVNLIALGRDKCVRIPKCKSCVLHDLCVHSSAKVDS